MRGSTDNDSTGSELTEKSSTRSRDSERPQPLKGKEPNEQSLKDRKVLVLRKILELRRNPPIDTFQREMTGTGMTEIAVIETEIDPETTENGKSRDQGAAMKRIGADTGRKGPDPRKGHVPGQGERRIGIGTDRGTEITDQGIAKTIGNFNLMQAIVSRP